MTYTRDFRLRTLEPGHSTQVLLSGKAIFVTITHKTVIAEHDVTFGVNLGPSLKETNVLYQHVHARRQVSAALSQQWEALHSHGVSALDSVVTRYSARGRDTGSGRRRGTMCCSWHIV